MILSLVCQHTQRELNVVALYDANGNFIGEDSSSGDVRTTASAGVPDTNTGSSAPAKAPAAPTGGASKTYLGLAEALNKWQQDLVEQGIYDVADRYVIKFDPTDLESTAIAKEGITVKDKTPMTNPSTAPAKVDSDVQSVNSRGRLVQVVAGTQIIQFITQTVSSSAYITGQARQIYDEEQQKLVDNPTASKNPVWFKVGLSAVPIARDEKRKDYAYEMTFTITPYIINELISDYFYDPEFRGVHKVYNYWFTGQNTQVLDFQVDYDNLYTITMTGGLLKARESTIGTAKESAASPKRAYKAASAQSTQGADDKANEPSSNAMEYLFSPGDQQKVTLKIIGDPAWISQGELGSGANFTFEPFLPDGTINSDIGEVIFALNFNQLADYDLYTGLVDVNGKTRNLMGAFSNMVPQESMAYKAMKCVSTFSRGKFEQELEGTLLTNLQEQALITTYPTEDSIREQIKATGDFSSRGARDVINSANGKTQATTESSSQPNSSSTPGNPSDQNTKSLPAGQPQAPTSSGDIRATLSPGESVVEAGVNQPAQTNQVMAKEA